MVQRPSLRNASLDFRLFQYWVGLPSGHGVRMREMMEAVNASDSQVIRSSLTRLRKGEVPDPSHTGSQLRALPIRWNSGDRKYYDMSSVNQDTVSAMIPSQIFSYAFGQLMSRVVTSLAEIPMLRSELNLLSGLFEEFGELIRDPDNGLELRPEIKQRLSESSGKPKESLFTSEGILGRLGC